MEAEDTKPQFDSIGRTTASAPGAGNLYNDAAINYNDADILYGGVDRVTDLGPLMYSVEDIHP